jgi:hypothetical protein
VCETWSVTIREEHRLRVFKNRVLGKTSGSEREKVIADWTKLHNEELHDLYFSPVIPQLVRKFPTFYSTRRFITVYARAHHLSLS